ncbi:MAG: hypothetical protein NZ610_04400 [Candidatus Bipolaricaulota bacterium]|nr:hypothetical protein [Candidatus Bipolaricaulota bacterium]MCS7274631.1 hypothetical protein [Candidatus Bipolaricaulota bacterium]MDW8110939.1 hypothetical protein [Candidatus Bipolaricaulota bacterium]MDW8329101.1 hypothetical protein [Candidatus Bipolaricaulota bacterium]
MSLRTLLLALLGCGIWAWGGWAAPAAQVQLSSSEFSISLAEGAEEIESLQFQVFDLSGRRIFNSGTLLGVAYYKWYFHRNDRQLISNGVYLYLLTTRVGRATYTMVGKLVVRR